MLLKFLVFQIFETERIFNILVIYILQESSNLLKRPFFTIEAYRGLLAGSRFHYRGRIISNSNSQKWKNFKRKKCRRRMNFKENTRKFDEPELVAKYILCSSPRLQLWHLLDSLPRLAPRFRFVVPTCRCSHIPFSSQRYMRRRQESFVNLYHDLWSNPI